VAITRVSSNTRKEDDRLRKELANADLGKFKKAIKSILTPTKKKSGSNGR
jgi:hypothetical protein